MILTAPNLITSGYCTQTRKFLNRTTGLMSTRCRLYDVLIRSLISEGVWNSLGALYILAAPDVATAKLNLVSTSFNLTVTGAPTFTANQGYTGSGANTDYLDTGYTPSTAGNMTQNSAAIFAYVLNNRTTGSAVLCIMGTTNSAATSSSYIYPNFTSNLCYAEMNSSVFPNTAQSTSKGSFIISRTASTGGTLVRNADAGTTLTATSVSLPDETFLLLATHTTSNAVTNGTTDQLGASALSSGLTLAQARSLSNRVNAFMKPLRINVY